MYCFNYNTWFLINYSRPTFASLAAHVFALVFCPIGFQSFNLWLLGDFETLWPLRSERAMTWELFLSQFVSSIVWKCILSLGDALPGGCNCCWQHFHQLSSGWSCDECLSFACLVRPKSLHSWTCWQLNFLHLQSPITPYHQTPTFSTPSIDI